METEQTDSSRDVAFWVTIPREQFEQLQEKARQLNISVGELAAVAIFDLLQPPDAEFEAGIEYLLEKNAELYRRLAPFD